MKITDMSDEMLDSELARAIDMPSPRFSPSTMHELMALHAEQVRRDIARRQAADKARMDALLKF